MTRAGTGPTAAGSRRRRALHFTACVACCCLDCQPRRCPCCPAIDQCYAMPAAARTRPPGRPPASTLTRPPTWECGIATPSGSGGGSSPSIIARRARYMSCAQWHGVGSRQHGQGRDQGQQGSRAIQAQSNGDPTHVLTVHSVPTPPRPQPHPLHTCPPACLRRRSGSLLAHSSGAAPGRSGAP
jgi:hypothetical protein